MAKYICLCGSSYKNKEMAELHAQMNEGHLIVEKSKKARFWDWFWQFNWPRFVRFTGGFMVYMVFVHHFKIEWAWWEAALIGFGMGLYIE